MINYCPECGDPVLPGAKCKCKTKTSSSMPTLNGLKSDLTRFLVEAVDLPKKMPKDPQEAAEWFLKLIEPHHPSESPRKLPSRGDKVARWAWDYADRAKICLVKFLAADEDYQSLIIAAKEDGIPWRGDEKKNFFMIIEEHEKMKIMGIEAYREQCLKRLRNFNVGKTA